MALPILAIIQAVTTLTPLFSKKGPSEKEEAKKLLAENHGPVSSSLGVAGMVAAAVMVPQVDSLESAIAPLVSAIVGLICYFYRKA